MYGGACQPLEVLTKSLLLPTYNKALSEEGAQRPLDRIPSSPPDADADEAVGGDEVR